MVKTNFDDVPPAGSAFTDYDRRHMNIYVRLLDAEASRAAWGEVARVIFGLDPKSDYAYARRIYDMHLARAHWLVTNGYRDLIHNKRR